jgi:hypothetical protein
MLLMNDNCKNDYLFILTDYTLYINLSITVRMQIKNPYLEKESSKY